MDGRSEAVVAPGAALPAMIAELQVLDTSVDDAARIDAIRLLEQLKAVVAAAQVRMTAAFAAAQRDQPRPVGVSARQVERSIVHQVGLARRVSPFRAGQYTKWVEELTTTLPCTLEQLAVGKTTEWRAMVVARETGWLTPEQRSIVDAELAPRLETLGDRKTEAEAKMIGYRLDPHGYVNKIGKADADRRVSLRPAPDTMARLSALLPLTGGVSAYAALSKGADALRAEGDPRSRGQIMADLLIARLTGQEAADAVPVEVQVLIDADTLLDPPSDSETAPSAGADVAPSAPATTEAVPSREPGAVAGPRHGQTPARSDHAASLDGGSDTKTTIEPERGGAQPVPTGRPGGQAAWVTGYGPVPAPWARNLVLGSGPRWLRRLYTRPGTGELVAMDSRRRCFTTAQRRFVIARDQTCRTPWCEAPIRHIDHITPAHAGGPTSIANAAGLCAACNLAKESPGWRTRTGTDGSILTRTPTGHHYRSRRPDLIWRPTTPTGAPIALDLDGAA